MISTLGGLLNLNHLDQSSRANDVIVIRHRDGSLHSTPFNVRFGRRQMWSTAGRVVQVEVNGELTSAVMKIGKGGETYWLQPTYGAFGHHAHPHRDSVRASTNATEERGRTTAATAAAAAAAAAAVAAAKVHANRDMPRQHSSRSNDDHHNGGLPGGEANPPLVVNAADLRHFSIHPESPPELSASETSPRQGDQNAVTDPQSGQLPRLSAVPPSALSTTAVMHTMKATSHGPSPVGPAPADASELIASPNSLDSTSSLPLLHRGDNGDLVVETRAIHSAEDVQEARLALQVMAAAEKSRRRLSKLLLKEDSFFLQSAEEEEGQLDATTGGAAAAATADVQEATHRKDEGQVGTERNPQTWNAESSSEDKEKKAAVAAAAAVPAEAGPTATAATSAGIDGEVAVPVPPTASAASPSPHHKSPSAAAAPVDDAEVSSVGSASGSTDSYKVEDTDDYFLETIDADEYAAMYGEEELLKNVSFSSSVTSGVSITDAVMSGSGSDVSKTSPAGRTTGDAAVVAATAAAISTPAAHAISTSAQHDSPLNPGKAGGGGGVSALSAAPTAPATRAKADTAVDDVTEVLDAEGRVVHHPSSAVVAAAAVAAADAAEGGGGGGSYFTRTLIPVEADLWKLHLRDGCNKVRYLARKDKGEVVSIACNIFLWNWTDRLVVSDVDGTITKSDLWGHFYAMLGKGGDWTHPGICTLYSKIARNGYRMVYLTARSVSQINQTKAYLFTLQQDGVGLPLGPVLTAPQRFFTALTQEVSKQSHVFKIACLTSVRAAFPPHTKPFFAGFGNRYNDVISYDAVGIPTHKIFIIDPSSVLHVCLVRQTYRDLGHLVDVTFPPLRRNPVVLRAPPLPRRPQQLSEPASKHKDDGHAPAEGEAGKDARRGMERHAYARDLLHRSSSASSSSSSSSSCSEAPSGDYSSDPQEHGSASLECSMGSASATLASGGPPPPHEQQHHHHHHSHGSGEAYNAVRPASVAFSLVDSFVVAAHGESSGSSSDGGAAARTSAAVAPSNTRTAATHAGERGPATPSSLSSATYGALSSATKAAAVPAGGAAPPLSASRAKPTASWEVGSTEYSCFSGPASTSMGKTTAAAAPAGQGTEVAGGPSSSGLLAGTALPNAPSFTAASATTAAPSHAASLAAGRGGGPSGGADNTSRHQSNGPTYNYGQRGRFDGSGGNSGGGGGDCVEDYEEEEVPVDPDFSSFAYWRMDPRDLIAPSVKVAAKAEPRSVRAPAGAESAVQSARRAEASSESRASASPDKHLLPFSSSSSSSREVTAGNAGARTSDPSSDLSHPAHIQGQGLTVRNSTEDAVAAVKAATLRTGGTVDAHNAGVGTGRSARSFASTFPDFAAGADNSARSLRDDAAAVKAQERASSSPLSPTRCINEDAASKSRDTTGTTALSDARQSKLSLTSLEEVAASQSSAASVGVTSTTTATKRRGFFSAFTFGRGQTAQTAPESPNTLRAQQFQEEAKKKALAHPDAWEYYRAQQQQQQQAPATDGSSVSKAPSFSTK